MSLFYRLAKLLPKKKITITQLEYEKERERRRQAAENIAERNVPENDIEEDNDGMVNGEYEVLERLITPERIVCPHCGEVTWEGLDQCDKCGKEI